jgi:hypothetical protein
MVKRRSLFIAALLLIVSGFVATLGQGAKAQDDVTLTASVVTGSCDDPGDAAGELRDLAVAEGGVLTSFSRVDVPIDEFTADGYAVVVELDGDTVACGDATGDADDVYVAVKSTSDDGYGGIAWLHARDSQTQVSLFISQGLGGSSLGDIDNPEPPTDETPEPPVDETPEPTKTPKPAKTPKATEEPEQPTEEPTEAPAGDLETYESPTWGYSIQYDPAVWEEKANETNATQNGPQDWFVIGSASSTVYLYSVSAPAGLDLTQVSQFPVDVLSGQTGITNVEVVDQGGEATAAWYLVHFTWTNQSGTAFEYFNVFNFFTIPDQPAVAVLIYEDLQESYDLTTPLREQIVDSFQSPS